MNNQALRNTLKWAFAFLFAVALGLPAAQATHNRAGEITFQQLSNLTFEITITTYTKASSIQADRDSLELCFGDGSCRWVVRNNGPGGNGELLGNDIKKNTYVTQHAYGGPGTYVLSMTDPNRNGGILNVNFPYSDQVPFHLETMLVVLNPVFSGFNTSPILTNPPIDEGCVNQKYEHNPGAYDAEGDSIAYELIVPLQGQGTPVSNYVFPNRVGGTNQPFDLNPVTGTLFWNSPQQAGEYNVAFYVKEYRNGVLISQTIRDMQITIENCNNRPPVIDPIPELCVVAGDTIRFNVRATDPDSDQDVTLTAVGGPVLTDGTFFAPGRLIVNNPNNPVNGVFEWVTRCEHVQDQYYQLLFKAEDDYTLPNGNPQHLIDYQTVRIKVVGPPPTDPQADVQSGEVSLSWDGGYVCQDSDNFFGFSVWRREGSNPFQPDTCNPSLAGQGYTLIADNITATDPVTGRFVYEDTGLERGRYYCYRIVGDFAEFTPSNTAYSLTEGLPSEEVCVQMSRDLPLMTHVTVNTTDLTNGEIYIEWTRPDALDLDTVQNPGPYEYRLFRATNLAGAAATQVYSATSPTYAAAVDTFFTDTGLATDGTPHSYYVEFYTDGNLLGTTQVASQVFLTVTGTDQKNVLTWEEDIPWEHLTYTVLRENPATGVFDSIGITTELTYEDLNLVNGQEYCYQVKGTGTYNIPGVIDPIINFSQEVCAIPVDSVPPCPPVLEVMNRCNTDAFQGEDFENWLDWTNPNDYCANDVMSYRIYYAPTTAAEFSLLASIDGDDNTSFEHLLTNTIAGCYYVTALDSVGNESEPSNVVCVDNCPEYELPNVFTPNDDGKNDLFMPFPYLYIARVDITIVDRWGVVMFRTQDPDIRWDGTTLQGAPAPVGTYFYKCVVYELRVDGEFRRPDILSGYIELLR